MTTVAEQMSWTASADELKAYLGLNGISGDQQTQLKIWLDVAIQKCDEYLERDFVVNRARWVIGPTVEAGFQYTLTVKPEGDLTYMGYSASYTASAGDSAQKVAFELRVALDAAAASHGVTVGGAGAAVEAVLDDPTLAMEASKATTGGTITQTLFHDSVPTNVRFGVYEYVKALKAVFRRAPGVVSKKTAALAETYAQDGSPAKEAFKAAKGYWAPFKAHPLLDGEVS